MFEDPVPDVESVSAVKCFLTCSIEVQGRLKIISSSFKIKVRHVDSIYSFRNGRRLKRAWSRVAREIQKLRDFAANLTVEDCEGDASLFPEVVAALRAAASLLEMRFKYLKIAPWNFCNADTPAGAAAFLESATSLPFDQQDELTQFLYYTHRDDLEALAAAADGDLCTPSLQDEVDAHNDSPLDESAGEGYHRSTHCTRIRARNSTSAYVKMSTRLHQNVGQLQGLVRMGVRGKMVLRYEWRNWSRALQVKKRAWWRARRMSAQHVFDAVYHQDLRSEEAWGAVATSLPAPGQGIVARTSPGGENKDSLRVEYLLDVLESSKWYQVEVPAAGLDEAGRPVRGTVKKHMQLVAMSSVKSRPKLMPTVASHEDPIIIHKLALHIQEVSVMPGPQLTEGTIVVYPDADPRWVSYEDLGPWNAVMDSLAVFQEVQGLESGRGCLQLSNLQVARPTHPLTDLKCPTLCMLTELHRRGWNPLRRMTTHNSVAIGNMDGREAIKMKSYYIVLLDLENALPFAVGGAIPSDQPIAYYQCLLDEHHVAPGLGAPAYRRILQGLDAPEPPALEDGEEEDPLIVVRR